MIQPRTDQQPACQPSRRDFLAASSAIALGTSLASARLQPGNQPAAKAAASNPGDTHRGPVVIASGNGLRSVNRAMELMKQGYDPADCIVQGVTIIEDDPNDMSVGLGGLPNAEGVVELDASVMYGPTHKSGAVASVRGIKNVAAVALLVLRRTDHALLVGEGATRFAKFHGFPEENLLTEAAREQWVKWKENLGKDAWLNDDERDDLVGKPFQNERHAAVEAMHQMYTYGTVHCSAVTEKGDIASCTSTSGLSWKIPGRVGDSPIIGAGNYCDNAIGAAGCTGRGESAIANLSAYSMVRAMESGMTPAQAAMDAAKRAADHTKEKRLRRPDGKPNFNISFYCCRKDGAYGGASFYPGGTFAVHDGTEGKLLPCASLFEK